MATLNELIAKRYGEGDAPGDFAAPGDGDIHATIEGLLNRRSLRAYKDEPIPDDLLRTLLACAQCAPTKSNLQQYSIVVVKDPAQRAKLAPVAKRTKQIESAPLLLAFCADARRDRKIGEMRGHANANDNLDTLHNAIVDAALALGFFVIAAEAAGLRCAPLSSMRDDAEGVAAVLGLPPGVFCIAGVMAGWPAAEGHINPRLPQSVVIHTDRYDESNLEAEIDAYDRRRHAIHATPPENQRHPDIYGYADPYFWSEGVARQLAEPEREQFRDFLLKHGFALK